MRLSRPLTLLLLLGFATPAHAGDAVNIYKPADGATVPPRFTVRVKYGHIYHCDAGGCTYMPVSDVALYTGANTELLDSCRSCETGEVEFDVTLPAGPHELYAVASTQSAMEESNRIRIEVDPTLATNGDFDTTDSPATTDGCDCGPSRASGSGLLWFAVLPLLRRRPRAHQA
jgi:hypothetical protein